MNLYIQKREKINRLIFHLKLALSQIRQHPVLLLFALPILFLILLMWLKIEWIIALFNPPEIILPIFTLAIKSLAFLLSFILIWGMIDTIGNLTAQKDEATIKMAFRETDLRNGNPILVYKQTNKISGETIREWYSPIPKKIWFERQEEISDAMNLTLTKEFQYGKTSNRIVMFSVWGREIFRPNTPIYDNVLEEDMERYLP